MMPTPNTPTRPNHPADDRSWIAVGAKVAEFIGGTYGPGAAFTETVTEIARGWVHLANGRRYRRTTGEPAKTNTGLSSRHMRLRPLTDPDLRRALACHEFREVSDLAGQLRLTTGASDADVDTVVAALDELAARVERARENVRQLSTTNRG